MDNDLSTNGEQSCPECNGLGWLVKPDGEVQHPEDETCPTCGGDGVAHE